MRAKKIRTKEGGEGTIEPNRKGGKKKGPFYVSNRKKR